MSRSKRDGGLTSEDLKKRMYQSLQSAGVLNNLKGYLRQSVINELRGRYKKGNDLENDSDLLAATMKKNSEASWNQKAIDNLILHHLKQSRYLYSLSLFQQEAGVDQYDETLTEELLVRLGASPDLIRHDRNKENDGSFPSPHSSSTPVAGGDDAKLLMWKILSQISSAQNLATKMDESSFKESHKKAKPMSLADKLQAVDDEMDGTLRERRHGDIEYRKSIATLASATRRAEEAADKRAKESFEQWKKVELASARVREQEKTREQVLEKTHQLENDFAQRKEALVLREKNAIERLNNQRESLEKDLHQQRQLLLHELEQIRVRERNLQDREQMLRDTEAVKLKELELMKSEVLSHQGLISGHQGQATSERTRKDSAVSSCAESLRKSLTGRESRQLDEVLRELDSRSNEAEMLRRELMSMKEELTETKTQMKRLSQPEPKPSPRRQTDISPRDGNDQSLRKRLDDLTRQLNEWKEKDKTEKEETIQTEVNRWRKEISKLSDARDQLDEKQRELEEMTMRVNTRLNTTPRGEIPPVGQLPTTSLRILMDPQNDITRNPSIRDYDPIHKGHIRWADEMPYSIRPDLVGQSSRSSRFLAHNVSGNSNIELDTSNETTSSNDLSTSGLRRDIRGKFKDLEKESEDLEQMYKRYVQSNYKHISPDMPGQRSPRPSPRFNKRPLMKGSSAPHHKSTESTKKKSPALQEHQSSGSKAQDSQRKPTPDRRRDIDTRNEQRHQARERADHLNESEGPLDLKSLEKNNDLRPKRARETKPKDAESHNFSNFSGSEPKKSEPAPPSGGNKIQENAPSPLSSSASSVSEEVDAHDTTPEVRPPEMGLKPAQKLTSLPPLTSPPKTPPPISPHKGKSPTGTVSELLIGRENFEESHPNKASLLDGDELFRENPKLHENPLSSSTSSEISLLMRKSLSDHEAEKSPFERPALLERKREELQKSFDFPNPVKSPIHDQKSPKRDLESRMQDQRSTTRETKLALDLHDDDGIQNILHSIDVSSARSMEGETDQKLADLLSQLEQQPTMTSEDVVHQPEPKPTMTSQGGINQPKPKIKMTSQFPNYGEDSTESELSDNEIKGPGEEVLGGKSADEYSEQFLSSTSSKTASAAKTMSDFEPSSTSIPRIEDKVTGMQHSDNDKSEADVNWSNLQLDRSGEIPRSEVKQVSPQVRDTRDNVNVFEESQSEHSFEAPSDGEKKSHSSGDDFW